MFSGFFSGDANAVQKYRQLIVDKGNPDNKGTKVATGNNVGKMTDTSQYTGKGLTRFRGLALHDPRSWSLFALRRILALLAVLSVSSKSSRGRLSDIY